MEKMQTILAGYKQTEIGVIPMDWDVKKIDEIADVFGGGTPSTSINSFWNGNIEWFTPTEIGTEKYVYSSKRKITEEGLSNSSAKLLNEGTVLLTSRAGIGDLAILKTKSCTNQGFQSLAPKHDTDSEFLYYLMLTKKNQLLEKASGSTFLEISPGNVKSVLIQYPKNPKEQTAIAAVLSDTDALIENLEKLISKKKAIKQGAMQQLLTGKKRLPGFSGEWKTKKLGEIAEFHKGKGLPKSEISDNGRYKCIHYGELFTLYNEEIKEILSSTKKRDNSFLSRKNDVLMPTSDVTPNGLATASCVKENDVILGGDILTIRSYEGVLDGVFLAYGIRQNKKQIMQLVSGSTVYHLYGCDMKKYKFKIPPTIEEQTAIAAILSDMDIEIEKIEQKRDKYTALKQGMMQQLLTGRIRLI